MQRIARLTLAISLAVSSLFHSRLALGQESSNGLSSHIPYRLDWTRHYELNAGIVPAGTSDDDGVLWLLAYAPHVTDQHLVRVSQVGELLDTGSVKLPLRPTEWIADLSPASSGRDFGLLASLASGGKNQMFEGAFFVPIIGDEPAKPIRISGPGPQFTVLAGAPNEQFIAVGDQSPLTLIKVSATGSVVWRRNLSHQLFLPTVSVGESGLIYVLSQSSGNRYVVIQVFDSAGRLLRYRRISGGQGTILSTENGGCTVVLSRNSSHDEKDIVRLLTLDENLKQSSETRTPLIAWYGRDYQLVSSPRGYLLFGDGPKGNRQARPPKMLVEYDRSGTLAWKYALPNDDEAIIIPFRDGFYVIQDSPGSGGMNVDRYLY